MPRRQAAPAAKKKKSSKKKSIRALKKKAWVLLSQAIRLEQRDANQHVTCITCKVRLPWNKGAQAGHFIDGRMNSILFDERGIHIQCYACNVLYNGRKEEYFIYMLDNYGRAVIDEFRRLRNTERTFTAEELEQLMAKYRARIEKAKERQGI